MTNRVQRLFAVLGTVSLIANSLLAASPQVDVSKIVDKTAAESLLETKVKATAPRNFRGPDGYYSKCNYYSIAPGKTLVLRIYLASEGHDPMEQLNVITKSTPSMIEILGLGDKALATDGAASGLTNHAVMLYIHKGNTLVTVGLSGIENKDTALEKAKAVGAKILGQLANPATD